MAPKLNLKNALSLVLLCQCVVGLFNKRKPGGHEHQQIPNHYYQDDNNYQNGVSGGGSYLPHYGIPKDIMVDVINNMGLALLEAHNENNENNIAISPYGATSVLIALFEGLYGEAAYEIRTAIQLPAELSVIRIGLRDIHRHLKSYFIPKEGFLAGLTLSHDNITLNREYQSILKFYGYDIESFNNPLSPDLPTTTNAMSIGTMTTMRTAKTTTTTMPETTTMESISTIIDKLTSTIGLDGTTTTSTSITTGTEGVDSTEGSTKLPTPDDEQVEGTTTKKLPTRSFTTEEPATEAIAVTDAEGRTQTFYPMTTTDRIDGTTEQLITTIAGSSESDDKNARTEEEEEMSTLRVPGTTESDGTTSTFYEATTKTSSEADSERPTTTLSLGTTLNYEGTTTFEGSSYFATDSKILSTESVSITTAVPTVAEEFITLTERENEIVEELSQKLTKFDDFYPSTSFPDFTFSTTDSEFPYTQTQNTEATSLEDQVLGQMTFPKSVAGNSTFEISAKIMTNKNTDKAQIVNRRKRSVVDYLIARYYDNYYINPNGNRRYLPQPNQGPMNDPNINNSPKTHYTNYQPEEPYTFLVNGKYKETNISFMTYDTILPFYYSHALDAMALSFPLDSNMYYLLLVLPLNEHGIDKLINEMRRETTLRSIVDRLEYTHVKAVIPSFMLKGYVVLTPTLQKLCIRKIFEPRHADFSQMTPERNLYVTNIEQAVTVTIRNYVDPASHSARNLHQYRPVEFRADHPFLYFVMDTQIHVNLMAGKIINPLNSRIR